MGKIVGPFRVGKKGLEYNREIFEFPTTAMREKAYREFLEADRQRDVSKVLNVRRKYSKYIVVA